jgi:hypothetical protein
MAILLISSELREILRTVALEYSSWILFLVLIAAGTAVSPLNLEAVGLAFLF